MATNPSSLPANTGRITSPSTAYPYGSCKNDSTGTAGDGTPFELALVNDLYGLQQSLLRASSTVPNGNADTAVLSQYVQAIMQIASGLAGNYSWSGTANNHIVYSKAGQQTAGKYFDGMKVRFIPNLTGAAGATNVNVDGFGSVVVRLRGGILNPAAGDIKTGREVMLTYRTTPNAHFELHRLGSVIATVVSTSDSNWLPQPDAKAIQFASVGGGAGGGGVPSISSNYAAQGSGGGGGGFTSILTRTIDASYNIQIGNGGNGGNGANNGGNGGNTTVTSASISTLSTGGIGGEKGAAITGAADFNAAGGAGGSGSGGDINAAGESGGRARLLESRIITYGTGGGTIYGAGSPWSSSSVTGSVTPGCGGHGALRNFTASAAASGASGRAGNVIVTQWL